MVLNSRNIKNLEERFKALQHQEHTSYSCSNYLTLPIQTNSSRKKKEFSSDPGNTNNDATSLSNTIISIDNVMRMKICKWCYQVIDYLSFDREIVSVTLSYLDRYLNCTKVDYEKFQLAAMTSLYLAIKLYSPLKLTMSSMIRLSNNDFCLDEIQDMEKVILSKLSWKVHPPTSIYFVSFFFLLLPKGSCSITIQSEIMELSRFLTELSVVDSFFISQKQSSVGLAAILNALDHFQSSLPYSVIQEFIDNVSNEVSIDCESSDVDCCRLRLHEIYIKCGYVTSISSHTRIDSPTGANELYETDLKRKYFDLTNRQSRTKRNRH